MLVIHIVYRIVNMLSNSTEILYQPELCDHPQRMALSRQKCVQDLQSLNFV